MKILVVSLLRLGDIIMAAPLIQGLRRKHPQAEIDLLINEQFKNVEFLFPEVRKFHHFDREELQASLLDAERPVLESYDRLRSFLKSVASEKYDLVINVTQNKLSGYLTDLVPAAEKIGMAISSGTGAVSYGSAWFKYINDVSAAGARSVFHYSDIFQNACGLSAQGYVFPIPENENPSSASIRRSVDAQSTMSARRRLLVQATTSDAKKNISLEKLSEALKIFSIPDSSWEIIFITTDAECPALQPTVSALQAAGLKAQATVMSLPEVLQACWESDLLLTADTSIKHIAAGTPIKIVEIALGSSDPRKTGVYKEGAFIIQSREECTPCDHRRPCAREKHYCSLSIDPEVIAGVMRVALFDDKQSASILADEYADSIELFRTHVGKTGYWRAMPLRSTARPKVIEECLDLSAWKFFLDKEHLKSLAPYGTETLRLKETLGQLMNIDESPVVKVALDQMEGATLKSEARVHHLLSELTKRVRNGVALPHIDFIDDHLMGELRSVEQEMELGDSVSSRVIEGRGSGIRSIRVVQNTLNEIFSHQQIKLKMIRTLKSQMTERQ